MREGSDGLHLDGVHLLETVVEDARGVDDLEAQVVEVGVADVERLGGEGVGLHLHVGPAHAVDEAGLADVGVAGEEDGALIGVDGGQPGHMLPDLLEVGQRGGDLPDHGAHAPHGRPLERLAAVQRIGVLDELEVVPAHILDHILGGLDMPECQLVVILIIEHVEEVPVEGVDILHLGEVIQDVDQLLIDHLLAKFDLTHVEGSDARDRVTRMDHRRSLPLRLRQHDVDHLVGGGDCLDGLEVVGHGC